MLRRPQSSIRLSTLVPTPTLFASTIGVNAYLGRVALDTISFRPLAQADANSGVIISYWYANPAAPTERVKVTVSILDKDLRADALRVAASRQVYSNGQRSEEHTSELQSLMRISYAVFCLKKKKHQHK